MLITGTLEYTSKLIALFMDGRDNQAHWQPDFDQQGFRKLQARLDRLRHCVGDFEIIKLSSVRCITRTCHNDEIRPFRAGSGNDGFDRGRRIQSNDQCACSCNATAPQQFDASCVTIKDELAIAPFASDQARITLNGEIRHLMPGEHLSDELSDPAVAHDNDARRPFIRLRH